MTKVLQSPAQQEPFDPSVILRQRAPDAKQFVAVVLVAADVLADAVVDAVTLVVAAVATTYGITTLVKNNEVEIYS